MMFIRHGKGILFNLNFHAHVIFILNAADSENKSLNKHSRATDKKAKESTDK